VDEFFLCVKVDGVTVVQVELPDGIPLSDKQLHHFKPQMVMVCVRHEVYVRRDYNTTHDWKALPVD